MGKAEEEVQRRFYRINDIVLEARELLLQHALREGKLYPLVLSPPETDALLEKLRLIHRIASFGLIDEETKI